MAFVPPRAVTRWLYLVALVVALMVTVGGFVRLTRSGLSIVEWKPISGVIPPIGEEAWQTEFAKYKLTPEYQKVNRGMSLAEYQRIFYLEYIHRLIGRVAGLLVVLPLFYFLWRGILPWRHAGVYLLIAALFGFQAFLGWYMVSSGLIDRPRVDEFRLTAHLLTALTILALALWKALRGTRALHVAGSVSPTARRLVLWLVALVVLQIGYGGLVAGMRAGHISDTWPLMFGRWIPAGLLAEAPGGWANLFFNATTVHFVHRWFAFVVLIVASALYFEAQRRRLDVGLQRAALLVVGIILLQITLGVTVVLFGVPISLALWHQATAMLLFMAAIYALFLTRLTRPKP
ncbi:MAG: COX15/CtaA family protein [Caldilineales bacterium]|nr:COX15/CtaA family protein [Caldilineales bacterium]